MANHTRDGGKVLGRDSEDWGMLCCYAVLGFFAVMIFVLSLPRSGFGILLMASDIVFFVASVSGWILAQVRERQAEKEQEGRKEIQKLLSSPNPPSKLTADPALYRRAQAKLQARKEDALKMQELHALRRQVEEEERKAGIFAPTLSPTRSQPGSQYSRQADPMAAQMDQLARRKIETERLKHLMKSLRTVEDAEWEADDV